MSASIHRAVVLLLLKSYALRVRTERRETGVKCRHCGAAQADADIRSNNPTCRLCGRFLFLQLAPRGVWSRSP